MLWLILVILPLLGGSFIFSPDEAPDVMKLMPGNFYSSHLLFAVKNKDHLAGMRLYARYFIWRFSTVIAVTFVVYILYDPIVVTYLSVCRCLNQFYPGGKLWISAMSDNQWLRDEGGEEAQWAVAYAQMCACFVFVFNIGALR